MAARPTWKGLSQDQPRQHPDPGVPGDRLGGDDQLQPAARRVPDPHPAEAVVPELRARSADVRDRQGLRVREGALRGHRQRGRHREGPARVDAGHRPRAVHRRAPRSIPIYVERPYYLAPDGAMATEAFAVMREGMKGKAGIGKLALYGREYLVAVQAREKGLVMYTLRHARRSAQHGQHRGARRRAREDQAGRDQAGEAGDRRTSRATLDLRSTATSTRRSCSGSSTRRSPARKWSRPPRRRRRRSST